MATKYCGYCQKPINGEAVDIEDHSDRAAHPPAYWHRFGDPECFLARPRPWTQPNIGGLRLDLQKFRRRQGRAS
ncbi:hypothetical protein ACFU3J_01305 [Streptomyces sp. NPDC057411]|uniref:hypothetical protein n=1 Tax=unclassified Streptomyces TaxID=2593676 RepID=UPI00363402FC